MAKSAKEVLDETCQLKGYTNFMHLFWEASMDEVETVVLKSMKTFKNQP